eukprot:3711148-Pyramimonas_sp.AAC.1
MSGPGWIRSGATCVCSSSRRAARRRRNSSTRSPAALSMPGTRSGSASCRGRTISHRPSPAGAPPA